MRGLNLPEQFSCYLRPVGCDKTSLLWIDRINIQKRFIQIIVEFHYLVTLTDQRRVKVSSPDGGLEGGVGRGVGRIENAHVVSDISDFTSRSHSLFLGATSASDGFDVVSKMKKLRRLRIFRRKSLQHLKDLAQGCTIRLARRIPGITVGNLGQTAKFLC